MKKLLTALSVYFDWFYIPKIHVTDIIEIIILSYVIYHVMIWFKKTRAWTLFKGIVVLFIFVGLATLFRLNTILWIFRNTISVGIIAVIILFQPELRRALEELGRKKIFTDVLARDDKNLHLERVNNHTIDELVAKAPTIADVEERSKIYDEIQQELFDDSACVPICYQINVNIHNKAITHYAGKTFGVGLPTISWVK